MKRMYLYWMLLLLAGCATRKASTSVDQHTTQQSETALRQEQSCQQSEIATETTDSELAEAIREALKSQSTENLRVEFTLYDTSHPVDSATGRPPVMAEATLRRETRTLSASERQETRRESTDTAKQELTERADSSRLELTATSSAESDTKIDEKTKTVRRVPWWVWVVSIGVITYIGILILEKRCD